MSIEKRYAHPNFIIRRYHLKRLTTVLRELRKITEFDVVGRRCFLDVGCGDGTYIALLKHNFNYLIGLDISLQNLKFAKRRVRDDDMGIVDFVLADARYIPIRSSSIDVVLCSEVLEHIYNPVEVLKELFRITHRTLLITIPVLGSLRSISKILRYHRKLNEIEKHVGHVYMRDQGWWISTISKVTRERRTKCNIRTLYLYLSAEPFASIFSKCRDITLKNIINRVLDILEGVLSQPAFANQLIIISMSRTH